MTIVVGFVDRPEGQAALRRAIDEARLRDEDLLVLNTSRADLSADDRLLNEDQLGDLRNVLADSGRTHEVRQLVRGGEPWEELIGAAGEVAATMIVIGMRRRSPVGKLLMGSVAQRVLLESPCPVLAVHGEPRA